MTRALVIALALLQACICFSAPSEVRMTPAVKAANRALPWVVSIGTEIDMRVNDPYVVRLNDYFSTYFVKPRKVREYTPLGSGIIIHSSGLVLTNWHVTRSAETILLKLYDGKSYPARIIGYDAQCDLCLLRALGDFSKTPLSQASLAMPDDLLLGETVLTLGNPYGLEHSVSQGVLSAINRALGVKGEAYNDMLQTDAAINPGNSGGPLINLDGDVIGINQAIRSDAQGIGFAIPAKRLEAFLSSWLVPETFGNAFLGMTPDASSDGGVRISVEGDSPAARAGLSSGDVIAKACGTKVVRPLELSQVLWKLGAGDTLRLILADGRSAEIEITALPSAAVISRRLGLSVQKLTRRMNQAMGLPDDLKGLAISETESPSEYRDESQQWRQIVKRGDLVLRVGDKLAEDAESLSSLLAEKASGDILPVTFGILGNSGDYLVRTVNIRLQ